MIVKRVLVLSLAGLAFLVATTVLIANREFSAEIQGPDGEVLPGSIAVMDRVELGGREQFILVRGHNTTAPVLLWLHGGPGSPELPFAREFNEELEKRFLVVHWDQRGAGKSFAEDLGPQDLRIESDFVADAIQLSEKLIYRFKNNEEPGERKIYLFGHSWGSAIGILAAKRRPDLYHAYIAAGQVVHMSVSERRSYEWALNEARGGQNAQAVAELEAIGTPPYSAAEMSAKTPTHWKWVMQLGGALHGRTSIAPLLPILLFCDEYNLVDKVAFVQGSAFTARAVWDEFMALDLARQAPALDVPVFFLHGRHDRQLDPALSQAYFRALRAPAKTWVWFENSAHSPMFEEPERFHRVMIEQVLR